MAHVFAKVLEVAIIKMGIPTAIDGSIDRLVENGHDSPDVHGCRSASLREGLQQVVAGANEAGGLKLRIFQWAMKQGYAVTRFAKRVESPGVCSR